MHLPRTVGPPTHHIFRELPTLLREGDLLVVNRSRVFPARLLGQRRGGGTAEILLLRALDADERTWEAYLRPARRLPAGETVHIADGLRVHVRSGPLPPDGRRVVELEADGAVPDLLERHGHVPLPPYVQRADVPTDRERYQTVYARERGSVAAPTAGLHFTPELLGKLQERGIARADVVLHVGPGTFKPVAVEDVDDHAVDPERYTIPVETADAIRRTRERGGRVIAVGTTTTRTLEGAAESDGTVRAGSGETALFIRPGHPFRAVDGLVTNFHLPRSSLLMLVSAFAGRERVLAAYAEAVAQGYRFYSYGDAMIVLA
jgi:S-adenosylmethionine:tRNA ribosyltransferase-isomerase